MLVPGASGSNWRSLRMLNGLPRTKPDALSPRRVSLQSRSKKHEAPAPIGQEAQPAADRRACKANEAVTSGLIHVEPADVRAPAGALTGGTTMVDNLIDPLLVLLRRHEAANAAYDALDSNASEAERDHLYGACSQTMHAIIDRAPAATTAGGAVAALNHCPQ
jgi:hypothetical protein